MSLISVRASDRYKWLKFRILSLVTEHPRSCVAELGTLFNERMLLWRTSPLLHSEKETLCSNFRGLTRKEMSLCMKKNFLGGGGGAGMLDKVWGNCKRGL